MASPPFPVERGCLDPCLAAAAATDTTTPAADDDDNNNFPFLPEDAIFEILSWLPAKSLYRSRCVSKKWHALTSSPAFIAAHGSRAEPLLVFMTSPSAGRKADVLLQLMDTDGNVVVRVEKTVRWFHSFCLSYDGLAYLTNSHDYSYNQLIDLPAAEKLMTCKTRTKFAGKWIEYRCTGVGRAIKSGTPKIFGVLLESPITGLYQCVVLTAGEGGAWRPTKPPPHSIYAVYDNYNQGVTFNNS